MLNPGTIACRTSSKPDRNPMTQNLLIGLAIILATVCLHTLGLIAVTAVLVRVVAHFKLHEQRGRIAAMTLVVLGLFAVLTVEIWLWAGCYVLLGVVDHFETALYFSTTTFSTVGFGDVVPPVPWRLLTALEGINGFLLIGWSTAYLISAGMRFGPFRSGEHF